MALFFKSKIEEAKKLKYNLSEIRKKLDTIEEIDKTLYEKFKPKYEKEAIEIEQELCDVENYSSNLEKAVDFAIGLCVNSFFSLIPEIARVTKEHKKGGFDIIYLQFFMELLTQD